jgi:2-keto-4-pentenoate hydratase/2-oxohepta-3-ene-1,7-dioic acid hydratase in catechol pathway/uncharacterized membrane protein
MGIFVVGLVLFLGIHTVSIVAPQWREAQLARLGEGPWKGLYSGIAAVGSGLLIYGYGVARQSPIVLYTPPTAFRHLALLLMLPVFPLLVAAYVPGRIKAMAKHPMLLATKFWATAHLLANGTLADVLLFGGFLAWAVADRISVKQAAAARNPRRAAAAIQRRDRRGPRPGPLRAVRAVGAPLAVRRLTVAFDTVAAPRLQRASPPRLDGPLTSVPFDVAPFRFSGTVYGTLLNHRDALDALGASVHEAPYKAPPKSVVLYLKPRNTLAGPGDAVAVPSDAPELELGPSLGLVIGRTACRVSEAQALDHVAGCVIVADIGVPHASFYRPQVRFKARDGFCPIGPRVVGLDDLATSDGCDPRPGRRQAGPRELDRRLDPFAGAPARGGHRLHDARARRRPDDRRAARRTARAGRTAQRDRDRRARASREPLRRDGRGGAVKRARVAYAGAVHEATPHADGTRLRLADGRIVAEDAVVWLPPFEVGTVIALGLNYADHAKELAFNAQQEPLVFLKGPGALIGHRGQTRRPADATFMHYECELAVVIGRRARRVARRCDGPRRRLYGRERLCDPRLPRELVPPEPARQEPRHVHRARAVAGRCRPMSSVRRRSTCARSSTASSRSVATRAT